MIIVTGATGVLNGATVEHLLKLVPADRIGVSVRDVAKAQHLADRGVRVRRGSYDDPAALLDSFEGAEQVLLVSSSDPGADQVSLHRVGTTNSPSRRGWSGEADRSSRWNTRSGSRAGPAVHRRRTGRGGAAAGACQGHRRGDDRAAPDQRIALARAQAKPAALIPPGCRAVAAPSCRAAS